MNQGSEEERCGSCCLLRNEKAIVGIGVHEAPDLTGALDWEAWQRASGCTGTLTSEKLHVSCDGGNF